MEGASNKICHRFIINEQFKCNATQTYSHKCNTGSSACRAHHTRNDSKKANSLPPTSDGHASLGTMPHTNMPNIESSMFQQQQQTMTMLWRWHHRYWNCLQLGWWWHGLQLCMCAFHPEPPLGRCLGLWHWQSLSAKGSVC